LAISILSFLRADSRQLDEVVLLFFRLGDRRVFLGIDRVVDHATPLNAGDQRLLRSADRHKVNLSIDGVEEIALGF